MIIPVLKPDRETYSITTGFAKKEKVLNLDTLRSGIETLLSEYQQGQQFDDITMLALRRKL